jgi:NO-binding membrane sensor protein with MHYT domain
VLKVLTCLTTEHDLRLVVVAGLICFAACFTAFRLYSRMRGAKGVVRAAWLLLTGLVSGSGVWATHFIAMVAYDPGLKTGYSPSGTLLSLMIAVMFMAGGFAVASAQRSRTNDFAGGLILGMGIAAMHYTGMSAFVTQGFVQWEQATIALSVLAGVIGAAGALQLAGRARSLLKQLGGGAVLTLGVCALHFIGMGAITIVPDPAINVPDQMLSGAILTLAVTSITGMIILGGLGAVAIESSTSRSALDRIRRLANAAYEGIVVVQDGRINDANAAFCELAGVELEALLRTPLSNLLTFDSDGAHPRGRAPRRRAAAHRRRPAIPVEVFSRLMDDGARAETSGLTVLAVRDLRERRSAEEKIRYLAEHDGLTGLPNRNSLQARLAAALDRVEASGESLSLICIDLDHFKEANDLHGHLAGDALLVETARRCRTAWSRRPSPRVWAATSSSSCRSPPAISPPPPPNWPATCWRPWRRRPPTRARNWPWAPAWASRCSPTTAARPRPCWPTPTWRCTAPRKAVAAPIASSSARWTSRSASAGPWPASCARRSPTKN